MHKICHYIDFNIANMQIICKKYAKIYSICNKNMQKNMQNMHKSMYWHILHIYAGETRWRIVQENFGVNFYTNIAWWAPETTNWDLFWLWSLSPGPCQHGWGRSFCDQPERDSKRYSSWSPSPVRPGCRARWLKPWRLLGYASAATRRFNNLYGSEGSTAMCRLEKI